MQSWFSSSGEDQQQEKPASSLLADWNSYAATSNSNESSTGLASIGSFDLEAAVRSANDTVSGTFNVLGKKKNWRKEYLFSGIEIYVFFCFYIEKFNCEMSWFCWLEGF